MEVQIYVAYCLFIVSSKAFYLLPSFLDPVSLIEKNETCNEIPDHNTIGDHASLESSFEEDMVAEPASAVLSHLRSMLDSPYHGAKEYAAEKAKELVSNLEHNTNKVMRFTLGGVNLLVDLGINGSNTRLRNLEQGRSLMEYLGELFARITSWIKSWFVSEETKSKGMKNDQKDHELKEKSKSKDDSSTHDHQEADKKVDESITDDKNLNGSLQTEQSENQNHSDQSADKQKRRKNKSALSEIIFTPPKELSPEEKADVEKARQRIVSKEKALHDIEDKIKRNAVKDDEKVELSQLKFQIEMMKTFIRVTTSERFR